MGDGKKRAGRIMEISPAELYLAEVEKRIQQRMLFDIDHEFNIETRVVACLFHEFVTQTIDDMGRSYEQRLKAAFIDSPLGPWLKNSVN
jgi:hypothetical protein